MINDKSKEIQGAVSEDVIVQWKSKTRKIHQVIIEDDGDYFSGYFKRPDMDTLSAVTKLSKTDEVKAAEVLFSNCWLGGSDIVKEDSVLKMAAIGQLHKLMEVSGVELKNV